MSKKLYLTATAGTVHIVGDDCRMPLTPDVAIQIAADLPKFAAQARILAGIVIDLDYMAGTLAELGYTWQPAGPVVNVGHWLQNDGEPITAVETYDQGTRRAFAVIVCGAAGPVQ